MGIATFFQNPDNLSLALTLTLLSVYGGHFLAKWRVGNIREVQKRVLYGKAKSLNMPELIDFIDAVIKEDPRILMPAKEGNKLLYSTFIVFFIVAFFTIFYTGLSQIFSETFISDDLAHDIIYVVFFVLLGFAVYLLKLEYQYWILFGRLKTEYPDKLANSIIVCKEKSPVKEESLDHLEHELEAFRKIKSVVANIPPNINKNKLVEKLKIDSGFRIRLTNRLVRLFGLRDELIPYIDSRFVDLIDNQFQPLFIIETGEYTFKEERLEEFVTFTETIITLTHTVEKELTQEHEKHIKK